MASKSTASPPPPLQVSELCKVAPAAESPESATQFTLPLTYLDTTWFRFPPVELIFFYKPATITPIPPHSFYSSFLPKLKRSLSQTLANFLPLAGQLQWPPQSPIPIVSYTPGDGVSLTIAESDADLDRLAGGQPREAAESRPYVAKLEISETKASVIALQITYFPNRGFSIAITVHHAVLDGKTTAMFLRAWASICKHGENHRLPEEFTPSFDRTAVEDPSDLAAAYLNRWNEIINRQSVISNPRGLNFFQIPHNFFGNCLAVDYLVAEAGSLMGEDGIAVAAEKISELVSGVAATAAEVNSAGAVEKMGRLRSVGPEVQKFGVSGSHKLGFYQIDFGLGKPAKMETTSLDKTRGISVTESADGSGGIEVGVVLVRPEMEAFASFFLQAMKDVGSGHNCSRL